MFCSKCGTEASNESKFCSSCGTPMIGSNENDLSNQLQEKNVVKPSNKSSNKGLIIGLVVLLGLAAVIASQNVSASTSGSTDSSNNEIATEPDSSALQANMSWKDLSCGVYGSPYVTIVNGNDQIVSGTVSVAWKHGDGTVAGTAGASSDFLANSETRLKIDPPQGSISFATCEVYEIYIY